MTKYITHGASRQARGTITQLLRCSHLLSLLENSWNLWFICELGSMRCFLAKSWAMVLRIATSDYLSGFLVRGGEKVDAK